MARIAKKTERTVLLITAGLLIILFNFQNCSPMGISFRSQGNSSGLDLEDQPESARSIGNGNGTGYGGKPGDYYFFDPYVQCTPSGATQATNISGIIHIKNATDIDYYRGCDKRNGVKVEPSDISFSDLNPDVLIYRKVLGTFSFSATVPVMSVTNFVWSVCNFSPDQTVIPGKDFYISRILTVLRFQKLLGTYTMSVFYEKVTVVGGVSGIPQKFSILGVPAVPDGFLSTRRQYEMVVDGLTEFRVDKAQTYNLGRLVWVVDGSRREFSGGLCTHRDFD